jgi:Cu/Ag efflux protein CusF
MIVYEGFMGPDGLPIHQAGQGHELHLDADYYAGKRPVFGPDVFHTTEQDYDKHVDPPAGGAFDYPRREAHAALPRLDLIDAERHRVVADACAGRPRGFRRIEIKAGTKYARDGEVFGFEPREIHAERCEEIEIVLDNSDQIRHDLMILGLNPVFALNVLGPNVASARFVTPDQDVTLVFHCHVATHEKVGMAGRLVVGRGGERLAQTGATAPPAAPAEAIFRGTGTVIAVLPRLDRLIVSHQEIKGFMPAMEMSYAVEPAGLLDGLHRGDRIEFSINGANATITAVTVIEPAR